MNISQSAARAAAKLKPKIKNPHLDAEILLSHVLKKPREFLFTYPEKKLAKTQVKNYKLLIAKRSKGMPIAYLVGYKYFYGYKFFVNKHALIPRPETELMVEEALKHATCNTQHVTIMDVGTGSGCIIITLLNLLNRQSATCPTRFAKRGRRVGNRQFYATDISKSALTVARQNAKLYKLNKKITFLRGNLLEPILKNPKNLKNLNNPKNLAIITANLPYLSPTQINNSPTIKYEPKLALSAGPDGLKYYRQLFKQIKLLHVVCYVLCEIDPSQARKIKQLIKKEFPQSRAQIKKDRRGLNRLVIIKI